MLVKAMDNWLTLAVAGAMLLLAIALVAIRYGKNAKKPNAGQNQPAQS